MEEATLALANRISKADRIPQFLIKDLLMKQAQFYYSSWFGNPLRLRGFDFDYSADAMLLLVGNSYGTREFSLGYDTNKLVPNFYNSHCFATALFNYI